MAAVIPEFGRSTPGAAYVLRPGGYVVIFSDDGDVAAVATPLGFALPGGGQNQWESPEDAAAREIARRAIEMGNLAARLEILEAVLRQRGSEKR